SSSFMAHLMLQIRTFWKSLLVIGGIIIVLGITNPNLLYVCLPLAVLCAALAIWLWKKEDSKVATSSFEPQGPGLFESLKFVFREAQYQHLIQRNVENKEKSLWGQALGSPAVMVDPTLDCDLKVYISDIEMYSYKNAEPG
ncbi:type III secretion protein, partial [Vibrio cholerae]|nr:type III secretion protein [Vibrio cholerae]